MRAKILFKMLLLFFCTVTFICCSNDDELQNKVTTIEMYVSAQTDTYIPWDATEPIECMLVKEEGSNEYLKLGFNGIQGFEYTKGYEYTLLVEKTILANPPADGSNTTYRLINIISQNQP